mmetsp:Transcript_4935/g.7045  ORF Transcript_4935/g.7045 Transcript_4935/m.7045 type:complete len:141 (-) Transcript_4935:619-1041(-)
MFMHMYICSVGNSFPSQQGSFDPKEKWKKRAQKRGKVVNIMWVLSESSIDCLNCIDPKFRFEPLRSNTTANSRAKIESSKILEVHAEYAGTTSLVLVESSSAVKPFIKGRTVVELICALVGGVSDGLFPRLHWDMCERLW